MICRMDDARLESSSSGDGLEVVPGTSMKDSQGLGSMIRSFFKTKKVSRRGD